MAHVVRAYGETSQTFVADTVRDLDRLGWEGWVVTRRVQNRAWFPFPSDERVLLASKPSVLRRGVGRVLAQTPEERRSRWLDPCLDRAQPALVHAHFGWMGCDALPSARRHGVPLVVSFHGADTTSFPESPAGRRGYRDLARGAARLTAVSEAQVVRLRELGFEQPIDLVVAGVDVEKFAYRGALVDGDTTRLLFVGRHVPMKGLDVLMRAFAVVRDRRPDVRLDVIGDGPNRAEYEALAEQLRLHPEVTFLGAQPSRAVRDALSEAHVLVMPSRTTAEGMCEGSPVLTKEAQAVGVPVVATRSGGIPATIPPRYRDELVPEEDHEALAERILTLAGDRDDWNERARAGREWVEEQFDSRRLAERIAGIYSAALEEE